MGAYDARVIADGATNYWRLNEPSGTTAVDVVGGANGTISGGVTLAQAGALLDGDTAMVFNGSTGKVVTTANVVLPVAVTMEGWVKSTAVGVYQTMVSTRNPTIGLTGTLFVGLDTSGFLVVYNPENVPLFFGGAVVTDGRWHHLAFVFSGTTGAIYLDGVALGSAAYGHSVSTGQPVSIGFEGAGPNYWQGSLDEVAIYPAALSAATIAAHYALRAFPLTGYAAKVVTDGASNFWRLGESAGTTAVDIIGGATGTISGGVTLGQPGGVPGDTAMAFNGTTGTIQTVASVPIPLTVTIETWVKVDGAVTTAHLPFFSTRDAGTGDTVYVGSFHDGAGFNRTLIAFSGASALPIGGRTVRDGQWHHCVFILAASVISTYVDGVLDVGPLAFARSTPSAGAARLGHDTTLWMSGSLDEVAIYPRALAPAEVAAHYAAAAASTGGVRTLSFGYWKQQWPAA